MRPEQHAAVNPETTDPEPTVGGRSEPEDLQLGVAGSYGVSVCLTHTHTDMFLLRFQVGYP